MVRRLLDRSVDEEYRAAEDLTSDSTWQRARLAVSIITIFAICHRIYVAEQDVASAYDPEASAVQIAQLWTPHVFYMLAIVGIALAFIIASSDS